METVGVLQTTTNATSHEASAQQEKFQKPERFYPEHPEEGRNLQKGHRRTVFLLPSIDIRESQRALRLRIPKFQKILVESVTTLFLYFIKTNNGN